MHKDENVFEAEALFDTASRGSYFSEEFAEKIGYKPYEKVREIPLAVKGKHTRVVGRANVYLEIDGEILPGNDRRYRGSDS